jgi:PAS domain S-box-containing protein
MGKPGRPVPDTLEALQARLHELERLEARHGQVEAALRDSELRYRVLYDENPSMYFTVDTAGNVLSVNPFGASQLGHAVSDLVGKPVLGVFHPEDKESVKEQLRLCVENPGKAFSWEFRKVHRNGHVVWVREVARAVEERDGRVIVLIVCEDITGRKTVEEELRRARDEMELRVAERTVELRRSEAALRQSEQELQQLAGRLLTAQEDERRRVAREMHDDLMQRITGIAIQAARFDRLRSLRSEEATGLIRDIRSALAQLSADVHALSRRLHPAILADVGLVAGLELECAAFGQTGQLAVRFRSSDVPAEIDKDTAVCLYRITQEALRNVVKHARTGAARVSLTGNGALTLTIEDDGIGFDATRARGVGLGLASMEERARLIQAELTVDSRPGHGSVVRVRVPRGRVAAGG